MDSDDREHEDNDGQSQVSQKEEDNENGENDENVFHPVVENENYSADWGAQRPVENELLSSQTSIITVTPA